MKKFHLPLTTAISAAILAAGTSGCNRECDWQASTDTRVCVDNSGNRAADERCPRDRSRYLAFFARITSREGAMIPGSITRSTAGSFALTASRTATVPFGYAPPGRLPRGGVSGGIGEGHAGTGE